MAQASKPGPADFIGMGQPVRAEPGAILGFPLHEENIVLESAMPKRGINGGPGRITAYTPVGCQRLASLMTKIDWINFEQHVFCGGPKGELHGCSEQHRSRRFFRSSTCRL